MSRKSLYIVLVLVVVLSFGASVFAQEYWEVNRFTKQQERLKYKITSVDYSSDWDWETGEETITEIISIQYQTLEVAKVDEQTVEVTTSYTNYYLPESLQDQISLLGGLFAPTITNEQAFGELIMVSFFAEQLELEVGNNMLLLDGSKMKVGEKQELAGVEGYFCTKTIREEVDGKKVDVLMSEWVIAPGVGWPLLLRVYKDGVAVYTMELVEYSSKR